MKKPLIYFFVSCLLFLTQCSKNDAVNSLASNLNNRSVGTSANEFLSASTYTSVNIEIAYMPGYAPNAIALTNLQNFLGQLVNKPGGINITQRQIAASQKSSLTLTEIRELEKINRTVFTTSNSLGVFVLYTDGVYSDANTLGVAHKNTSMVIFGKTIHDNSGGVNQASLTKLETLVTEHEFGHLLGLVDLGSAMQTNHKDPASNHCTNTACLMYYVTQVNQMGGILLISPVPPLDTNCLNDLKANGGK